MLRNSIGKQLNFIRRDLKHISDLLELAPLSKISSKQYKDFLVINELYRQQKGMHKKKLHKVDDRIISISQPHIRPIVRGKAKAKTEFGAKVSISVVNGFTYLDHFSFDPYNEGTLLVDHVKKYYKRFGHYPEAVQCDQIYRNRENIKYCKDKNIRLSGPPLGRRKKKDKNLKQQIKQDAIERIEVERIFGLGKRRYGMNLILEKLPETSLAAVALSILVMNLDKILRGILLCLILFTNKALYFIKYIKNRITYFKNIKYRFYYNVA